MPDLDQFGELESLMARLFEHLAPADQERVLNALTFGTPEQIEQRQRILRALDPAEPTPEQLAAAIAEMERQF